MLPANALRLSALVAAAMTSGYLWRAAVESHTPAKVLRSAAPAISFELPDVSFSSLDRLRVLVPTSAPVGKRRAAARRKPQRSISAPRLGASQLIAAVDAPPTSSGRAGRSKHPSRVRDGKRASQVPGKGKRPKPGPPLPPPPPPPPPPVSPPEPPPPPPVGVETRPGRGKGDKNHIHTGPPGQKRRKGAAKEKGSSGEKGGSGAKKERGEKKQKKQKKEQN